MSGEPAPARALLDRAAWRRWRGLRPAPAYPALVICGLEHSGTSLLADLFRQVPGWGAGWETGVLLADRPAEFPAVEPHFAAFAANWGLAEEDVAAICAVRDHAGFYRELARRSRALPAGTSMIFDKTPRYFVALKDCLGRVEAPFIATYKDPRAVLHSAWLRAGRPEVMGWLGEVEEDRLGYLLSVYQQWAMHRMERRVLFVSLESLCLAAGRSCALAFEHAGLAFDPGYLLLRGTSNRATHGGTIMAGAPFGWRRDWPVEAARAVEARFSRLDEWFYG